MEETIHKPKVALMSYSMDNRRTKGTALYARKLIEGLLTNQKCDYYLVHYDKVDDPLYKKANEILIPKIKLPYGSRFVSQFIFFWKYRNNKFDVVHYFQPRLYPFFWFVPAKKIIVTVHGAGDISAPQYFIFSRTVFNFVIVHFQKFVEVFIADSIDAKVEIVQYYKFPESKVKVIYLGGAENYTVIPKNEAKELVSKKYGVNGAFILDVSRLVPHKNIVNLIKAYDSMRTEYSSHTEKLVIVGSSVPNRVDEFEQAKSSLFSKDICFIGFIDAGDLNAIYSASDLFVYPSLSEGFGLPILEAMGSGTPVVTSNITSMPEIAGDSALLVDPLNITEIATAMHKVLTDKELREKNIDKGFERVKKFTWAGTVQKTEELYK